MLELSPSDPIIKSYLKDLQHLKSQQRVTHELGLIPGLSRASKTAMFPTPSDSPK
jgi:hypothetical protein